MGFPRTEYWSGLPFPSPGDLPNPGIEPKSSTLEADSLPPKPPGKPSPSLAKPLNQLPPSLDLIPGPRPIFIPVKAPGPGKLAKPLFLNPAPWRHCFCGVNPFEVTTPKTSGSSQHLGRTCSFSWSPQPFDFLGSSPSPGLALDKPSINSLQGGKCLSVSRALPFQLA